MKSADTDDRLSSISPRSVVRTSHEHRGVSRTLIDDSSSTDDISETNRNNSDNAVRSTTVYLHQPSTTSSISSHCSVHVGGSSCSNSVSVVDEFLVGFRECADETLRYLAAVADNEDEPETETIRTMATDLRSYLDEREASMTLRGEVDQRLMRSPRRAFRPSSRTFPDDQQLATAAQVDALFRPTAISDSVAELSQCRCPNDGMSSSALSSATTTRTSDISGPFVCHSFRSHDAMLQFSSSTSMTNEYVWNSLATAAVMPQFQAVVSAADCSRSASHRRGGGRRTSSDSGLDVDIGRSQGPAAAALVYDDDIGQCPATKQDDIGSRQWTTTVIEDLVPTADCVVVVDDDDDCCFRHLDEFTRRDQRIQRLLHELLELVDNDDDDEEYLEVDEVETSCSELDSDFSDNNNDDEDRYEMNINDD